MGQRVLTMDERREIGKRWARGDTTMDIAYSLRISQSTVYAELRRGQTEEIDPDTMRRGYDPERGAQAYVDNIKKRGNRLPRMTSRESVS